MPSAARSRLFRRLKPATWQVELCPELADLLSAIIAADQARVIDLGYANVKAPELVAAIDRRPSAQTIAAVCAVGLHPDLVLTDDGVGCCRHYAEIDWTAPPSRR